MNDKKYDPQKAADTLIPDFLKFFTDHAFGHIDAITVAPRSIRNIDSVHPMDLVAASLSRHATHPAPVLMPEVQCFERGVVFVLDDVSTTSLTLKLSVEALTSTGVMRTVWMYYS